MQEGLGKFHILNYHIGKHLRQWNMDSIWTVTYWSEEKKQPLEAWFDQLTKEQLKAVAKEILLLERCGNTLRLPHSKSLGKGLFELREKNFGYRVYYAFLPNKNILLLHTGNKTSQKRDIELARSRLNKLIGATP